MLDFFKIQNKTPMNDFTIANSVDPDKMPRSVSFHLGLHCFSKSLFTGVSQKHPSKIRSLALKYHKLTLPNTANADQEQRQYK